MWVELGLTIRGFLPFPCRVNPGSAEGTVSTRITSRQSILGRKKITLLAPPEKQGGDKL